MIAEPVPGTTSQTGAGIQAFPWRSWALLLLAGIVAFGPLSLTWNDNPNYSFGWLIPFVSLLLFAERWPSRPPRKAGEWQGRAMPWIVAGAIIFFIFRLAAEADPEWRPGLWIMVVLYVVALLGWLKSYGGTPWLRHFAFPVCFLLLSLPWFFEIEYPLVQGLMKWNALVVAETLRAFGISATALGNIIQLKYCQLGVEEACSGILSLQASLMMGCLLGEVYHLAVARRFILVFASVALALLGNYLRTFFLGVVAFYSGTDAVAQWHDSAGYFILVFVGVGTWLMSLVLSIGPASTTAETGNPIASNPKRLGETGGGRAALRMALAIFLAALVAEAGTQAWFGWRELSLIRKPDWTVNLPQSPSFREIVVTPLEFQTLRCDAYKTGQWLDAQGWQWSVFWFQYRPKPYNRIVMDKHNPDICLPAVGMKKDREYPDFEVNANGIDLRIQPKKFLVGDGVIYLFWIVYADRGNLPPDMGDTVNSPIDTKFRAHLWDVWTGNRGTGVETMEVAVTGPRDYDSAQAAFLANIKSFVVPGNQP